MLKFNYHFPLSFKVGITSEAALRQQLEEFVELGIMEEGATGRRKWIVYSDAFKEFAAAQGIDIYLPGSDKALYKPLGDRDMQRAYKKWKQRA